MPNVLLKNQIVDGAWAWIDALTDLFETKQNHLVFLRLESDVRNYRKFIRWHALRCILQAQAYISICFAHIVVINHAFTMISTLNCV